MEQAVTNGADLLIALAMLVIAEATAQCAQAGLYGPGVGSRSFASHELFGNFVDSAGIALAR